MQVIYLEKLYKQKGIRRVQHFIYPRILDANSFIFPVNSVLHWWKGDEVIHYLTKDYGYIQNIKRAIVRTHFDQQSTNLQGKFTKKPYIPVAYLKENSQKVKEFLFLKPAQEMKITEKVLYINNYGPITSRQKYNTQPKRRYVIYWNTISSVINNLFKEYSERTAFLVVDMPTYLPTRMELNKYSSNLTRAYLDRLPTYQHLNMLELWKLITPEFRSQSVFNLIPEKQYKNVILLLCLDNKMLMLSMDRLMSMVAEYGIVVNGLQPRKADVFKKMFHTMITNFIEQQAMSDIELEQHEQKIESSSRDTNQNTIDLTNNNSNSTSFKSFSNALNNIIKQEQNDKIKIVDPDNIDDISDSSDDETIENVIDDQELELEQNIDDNDIEEEEQLEIVEQIDIPITNDADVEIITKDLEDDEISFKQYNTMDNLTKEEYNYQTAIENLEELKVNKTITNSVYNNIKTLNNNHMNSKDPYGSNLTIKDMLDNNQDTYSIDKQELTITDNHVILDKTFNKNITNAVSESYIKNQYNKDMLRVINSVQNTDFIVEDHKIEHKENIANSLDIHHITLRGIDNKTHNIKLYLPTINKNGTMKLGLQNYIFRKQRNSLIIVKIDSMKVKLTSYYGRTFVEKAKYTKDNIGYKVFLAVTKLYENGKIKNLVGLPSDNKDRDFPVSYSQFSRFMKSFTFKNINFVFCYEERSNLLNSKETLKQIEGDNFILVGMKDNSPVVIDMKDRVFISKGNRYEEIDGLYGMLGIEPKDMPIEYAMMRIYKQHIPVVIILSYYVGLTNLLKLLNVKYEIHKSNARIPIDNEYFIIRFQDVKLKIYRDYGYKDMILAGLRYIDKTLLETSITIFSNKNKMTVLFSKLGYNSLYINEIKLLETMFVDPITATIAKQHKLPTSFKGLLIEACKLLTNDNYVNPKNIHTMTIKGYERVAGMVYHELIQGIKQYNNKNMISKAKISINPFSILSKINEDSTTVLSDDLNPMSSLKQFEDVSFLGEGGFKKESMSKETRVYNKSEIGVMSEAVKDSGDVGITAYLSANPNMVDIRGNIGNFNLQENGVAGIYSTNAMLMPFSLGDDTKRLKYGPCIQ